MKGWIGCIWILLTLCTNVVAQDVVIREENVNRKSVDRYNRMAANHSNADSVYFYYNRALLIAKEIGYSEAEITACKGLVKLYKDDDEIYEKLRYSLMLVGLQNKHGSNYDKGEAYNNLGKLYFEERLFDKSVEALTKASLLEIKHNQLYYEIHIWLARAQQAAGTMDEALVTARKLEFEENLTLHQTIELQKEKAQIYHALKAYPQELRTYEFILTEIKGTSLAYLTPVTWNNIGYTNKYLDKVDESKAAFYRALKTAESDDIDLIGSAYFNLGLIYHNAHEKDSALICFQNARVFLGRIEDDEQIARAYNMEAMVYYQNDDQFNAQKNVESAMAIAREKGYGKVLARSFEIESYIHQDLFEFERALESYKKFLSIRDSLLTEERSEENKVLFDLYKVEQIEKQLRLIWAQNELDVINLAREKAEKEAERQRFVAKERENELRISELANKELKAREELNQLMLVEERLKVENQQKELTLMQRENQLKELALEKERLITSENQNRIKLLSQEKELEKQRRLNEEQAYRNNMQLILGVLFFIILILIGILFAYRQLRKRKKRIEQQNVIIEQNRKEIIREKEKSEGLLLNILPTTVAEELKIHGTSKPKLYNEVSVGFTDFSGFTMISEKLTPEELVKRLDTMFYEFDMIIEQYDLQRIKTIGDAYMFASGLPEQMPDHAEKIVRASLEMRDFITDYNSKLAPNEPKWNIRIGVNTGPVVAGVIGIKKFAYDIWGDTVNTAARMESSGQVGKVNISGTTYALVKDLFVTEHRGKVAAKNKGEIDMYFVENK